MPHSTLLHSWPFLTAWKCSCKHTRATTDIQRMFLFLPKSHIIHFTLQFSFFFPLAICHRHPYMSTDICINSLFLNLFLRIHREMHIHIYSCMYACLHIYTHVCGCTYIILHNGLSFMLGKGRPLVAVSCFFFVN